MSVCVYVCVLLSLMGPVLYVCVCMRKRERVCVFVCHCGVLSHWSKVWVLVCVCVCVCKGELPLMSVSVSPFDVEERLCVSVYRAPSMCMRVLVCVPCDE